MYNGYKHYGYRDFVKCHSRIYYIWKRKKLGHGLGINKNSKTIKSLRVFSQLSKYKNIKVNEALNCMWVILRFSKISNSEWKYEQTRTHRFSYF